jgi:transcriptional regulator with XRE-family HTH domain
MANINDRIKELIADLGLSKNQFAIKINTSSAMVSKITTQATNFGKDILEKILSEYPNLNTTWLLTGIGEMWNPSVSNVRKVENKKESQRPSLTKFYDNPTWKLARLLKSELQDIANSSFSDEITTFKTYRDSTAKILKLINSIDGILDENNEINIFEELNSGATKNEILKKAEIQIELLKEVEPHLKKLNSALLKCITELRTYDKSKELASDGQELIHKHLLEQEYDVVSKLKDKVKVYRRYTM